MARSIACISAAFSLWIMMPGTAAGQATVEYGLGAARAATTTAPARGIGEAISGLAASFDKVVKEGQQGSDVTPAASTASRTAAKYSSTAAKTPSRSTHTPRPPAPNWEDPSGIQAGLSYGEMVRRFGPPALEISGEVGRSLTYSGTNGRYQIEVQDEKVASIEKPKS